MTSVAVPEKREDIAQEVQIKLKNGIINNQGVLLLRFNPPLLNETILKKLIAQAINLTLVEAFWDNNNPGVR